MSRRIARAESTVEVARRVPPTKCAWAWTSRLAEFDPRYHDIAEVGVPIAEAKGWILLRPEPPRIHAGTLFDVLIEHSRMAFFLKDLGGWNPTEAEMKSADLFMALDAMAKAYLAATGDYSPFPLSWADYEGWYRQRGRSGRR
ncbi:MAG TPA: hypothetical protein PKE29_01525 [Phycisphaerales bacterium]|nr:hypothetical protein [Phycisphaerales bacterium]